MLVRVLLFEPGLMGVRMGMYLVSVSVLVGLIVLGHLVPFSNVYA